MKTQISRMVLVGSLVLAVLFAGCGGAGMDGMHRSSFLGQWGGTWDSPSAGANGTVDLTIDANGRVAGTLHDNAANSDATLSGTIARDGGMNAEARFVGQQPCSLNGLMMLNQQGHTSGCHQLGHMVGNLTLHMGSGNHETALDLAPR